MTVASIDLGSAQATSTDTLVFPIPVNVAASDPTLGATLIFLQCFSMNPSGLGATAPDTIVDSATTPGAYGTCFFGDGLNHYNVIGDSILAGIALAGSIGSLSAEFDARWGVIINPMVGGVDSITIVWQATNDLIFAYGRAYTGVNLPVEGPQDDTSLDWLITTGALGAVAKADGSNVVDELQWTYSGTTPEITNPASTSGPTDWQFESGGPVAAYLVGSFAASPIGSPWTWGDTDIATQDEFDNVTTDDGVVSMVYAEKTISPPVIGGDLSGSWAGSDSVTEGSAFALLGGPGPFCAAPPLAGNPVFNNHIRLSE